jgi:hypothetical protein
LSTPGTATAAFTPASACPYTFWNAGPASRAAWMFAPAAVSAALTAVPRSPRACANCSASVDRSGFVRRNASAATCRCSADCPELEPFALPFDFALAAI